jgi:hypothetical protein
LPGGDPRDVLQIQYSEQTPCFMVLLKWLIGGPSSIFEWANEGPSIAQRHTRYQTICRFADYVRLEDRRHDGPPPNHFAYRKTRRIPHNLFYCENWIVLANGRALVVDGIWS